MSSTQRREVVRLAVADADRADALRREPLTEVVVEPAGGTEQPAHPAAAHHDDVLGLRVAVPEQREQTLQRVDLEVVEVGRDLDVLGRERLEQLERRARPVAHSSERRSSRVRVRSSAPAPNSTATKSVAPASATRWIPACTSASVPMIATSSGPGRALAVEHRPVGRQDAVDLEDLARRGRAPRRRRR